jgi:hypothetical protein
MIYVDTKLITEVSEYGDDRVFEYDNDRVLAGLQLGFLQRITLV